jgi:predicted O-linked N-acetylglucosamine transferase (SPINDLY family)
LGNFGLEKELYTVYKLTGHFWKSNMTNAESPQQTATLTIEQSLQQAIAHQQAGQLQEAGELYRVILQAHPNHPEANYNMGGLAVQMKQPAAGLPYFMAALDAEPARGQYWLNYIDALFQAGQLEDARQVLALAQQQGLQGDAVEALALRLKGGAQVAEQANAEHQQALKESLPVSPTAPQNSQKAAKTKPAKPNKSAGKFAPHKGKIPSPQEINTLVDMFNQGRFTEAASLAQAMTERFPLHEFGWKALGALFKQMGRSADALTPMQKAAALSPGDVEAHYNLGVTLQDMGRLIEAQISYRRALKINPNYADAHSNLGVILQELGRLDEAETSYRRTLQISPDYAKAHSNLGAILQKLGRLDEAEASFRRVLQISQDNAEAHSNLGNALKDLGRLAEAEASYRRTLQINPDYAAAHSNLGIIFHELGRLDEAEASYRRVLEITPDNAEAHYNLGNILKELGRLDEAEASYRKALEIKPDFVEVHSNLGNTLKELGRLAEAEASYQRALQINPDYAAAHSNLGIILHELGRLDEAEISYRRALEIEPNYADAHSNLGITLKGLGRLDEAEASYRRALEITPDCAEAHYNLGNILKELGRLDEAEASYRRALQIKPDFVEVHSNLGITLKDLGRLAEAEASYQRALQIKPDYAAAHGNLGITLKELGRLDEAVASHRRALQIEPNNANTHNNLGDSLQYMNRLNEAEASYRRALEIDPVFDMAHSNLLFCLLHNETADAEMLFSEHLRFGEQFEAPLRTSWPQHSNSRNPDRCLQVGFVSGDLRDHAVASFIEPVLAHLARYPQLSLHAYANHSMDDSITQRLRGYFAHWYPIVGLSDAALAEKIRADSIDILIDLSGHTAKNRLLVFACKPAPVQASWMGYPGTTGLSAMDYYLADRFFLPLGEFDSQFTEKIVRLPAGVPFLPFKGAPPVNALPALSNGYMTFGSFNRLSKLSRSVIALWSQLLRALPDSRMVLGAMPQDGKNDTLIDWFAQEGIARERLSFHPRSGMEHYLSLHHQVDICLDTFPYNGGTTTLHALWMGVPTLTLAGSTTAGRPGVTILSHAGLDEFVAYDAADFVQKGLPWAGNLAALSDIRAGLRERFAQSAMGQPAVVAAGVERALRIMWQRWCAGLPPESFEVSLQDVNSTMQEASK